MKVSDAGLTVALVLAATPVPVREDDCGLLDALSVTLIAPVLVPVVVGVKVTDIVHEAKAAMLVPQVSVSAKSPDAEIAMLVSKAEELLLVRVRVCGALVVLTV